VALVLASVSEIIVAVMFVLIHQTGLAIFLLTAAVVTVVHAVIYGQSQNDSGSEMASRDQRAG
jgi:hypothetical protein